MNYLNEQKRTLSFLRLPFAAKRRRARPLVAAARRGLKLALVVVPVLFACLWFLLSDRFGLEVVEIHGAERVDGAWIEHQVAPALGQSLLLTDLVPLRASIDAHPWISGLRLKKELPRRLVVSVIEHVPAAVLENSHGRFLLSRQGEQIVALEDVEGVAVTQLPKMIIVDNGEAMGPQGLARLMRTCESLESSSVPWARSLRSVRVLSPEDVEFSFRDSEFSVLALAGATNDELEYQIATVHDLMPQLSDRLGGFRAIDLRFDRRIVLLPSAGPADKVAAVSVKAHVERSARESAPVPVALHDQFEDTALDAIGTALTTTRNRLWGAPATPQSERA